jgi:hypothetical protein
MLQPCSQAVDSKVDPHFGEGQGTRGLCIAITAFWLARLLVTDILTGFPTAE